MKRRVEPMELELNLYMTAAIGVLLYVLGRFLVGQVNFLQRYCIPAPVVGGLIFAILHLGLYATGVLYFTFDETLKNVFMTLFFTSVGYTACFRLLKRGGVKVLVFLAVSIVMVVLQNILSSGLGILLLENPLLGLATGSIPMVGGHGTAGAYGPLLENTFGVTGANAVAIAAATFGLVSGSLMGGPLARYKIKRLGLKSSGNADALGTEETPTAAWEKANKLTGENFMNAAVLLLVAAGLGSLLTNFLANWITLPNYIGSMIIAAIIRNIGDATHHEAPMSALDAWGNVSLSIFLAIALMTLKLWQLADLAIPMVIMLAAQAVLMFFYASFVVFNIMGRDYESAVMTAAFCGFGMGATPNAMANMQAVTKEYGPAPQAFFVVPLVGSLFIDFFNGVLITGFINFFA